MAQYPLSSKRALKENRCGTISSVCKSSQGKQVWHYVFCLQSVLSAETGMTWCPLSVQHSGEQVWHVLCLHSVYSAETGVTLSSLHAKRALRETGMTRCSVSAKTLRNERVWHHVFFLQNTQEGTSVTPCFLPAKHTGRNRCDTMFSACKTLRKEQVWHHVPCLQTTQEGTGVIRCPLPANHALKGTGVTRCSLPAKHTGKNMCDTVFSVCKACPQGNRWDIMPRWVFLQKYRAICAIPVSPWELWQTEAIVPYLFPLIMSRCDIMTESTQGKQVWHYVKQPSSKTKRSRTWFAWRTGLSVTAVSHTTLFIHPERKSDVKTDMKNYGYVSVISVQ